jgi:ABC-type sugar transport system ATPase subunit
MAVLVISSYLSKLMSVADRILVAKRGKIVEEIRANEATEERLTYAATR